MNAATPSRQTLSMDDLSQSPSLAAGSLVSRIDGALDLPRATQAAPVSPLSTYQTTIIILCVTCITAIGNLLSGYLTVCIPSISIDLGLSRDLQLWPAAAFALAAGCTLLPCGTVADILGCRIICLTGALLQTASVVAAGLSRTPAQLIGWRAVAGLASSFCLPSAVGIISHNFPSSTAPRRRNFAFAAMGGGQALGFGLGLVLGGICADTVGWRWGFYGTAILNGLVLLLAIFAVPSKDNSPARSALIAHLLYDIDWLGALFISTSLGILLYLMAAFSLSSEEGSIRPLDISLLVFSLLLLPLFVLWTRRQTGLGRPALIPHTIWLNAPFTGVSVAVFLVWGSLNASEQLTALYLQDVLGKSAITSSLYFLPAPICGAAINVAIAVLLPYIRPSLAIPAGCLVGGLGPLILSIQCRVDGPDYWHGVFQAMALNPIGADILYTIANLVVTDAFEAKTQALAGGIFNMLAQFGKSVGIATTSLIARRITLQENEPDNRHALLYGFRAGWYFNFGLNCLSIGVTLWGLRGIKRIGVKQE